MSRSIKKQMGDTKVKCRGTKEDRKFFHQQLRSKEKEILKESREDDLDISEQLSPDGKDYDLTFANRYLWYSDGGTYLLDKEDELKKELNTMFKDSELYSQYKAFKEEGGAPKKMKSYSILVAAFVTAPNDLPDEDSLKSWMNDNLTKILEVYKKLNYGK